MLPQVQALAGLENERRFLLLLGALLRSLTGGQPQAAAEPARAQSADDRWDGALDEFAGDARLAQMTAPEEQRLLKVLRSLGRLETAERLLGMLAAARRGSPAVQEAYFEVVLLQARALLDRGQWGEAERLLRPLLPERSVSRAAQAALLNLLGCCCVLGQDFEGGLRQFEAALKLAGNDPRLFQNIALTHELLGQAGKAEQHWNRFLDVLNKRVAGPRDWPDYADDLAFAALFRLVNHYWEKEKWESALGHAQRAHRLRPKDADILEKLFHLYHHVKRLDEARKCLNKLRDLKPDDPQYDLMEIDLIDVKGLPDIDRILAEIDKVLQRYPGDARVEQRAVGLVGNVIPLMGNLSDQLTEQLGKVMDQIRYLPNYQINWTAVNEVFRDLMREFQKLRKITNKCLPLVRTEEHRRIIRDLAAHIDQKIDLCKRMLR
jgi:tetratricopeptide (TPR) repeat protein